MAEERKNAGALIDIIRGVIQEEQGYNDNTVVAVVESVNDDKTLNLFILPDMENVIHNVVNQCMYNFQPGDSALLYKVDNKLSNSFVIAKYNPKPADNPLNTLNDVVANLVQNLSPGSSSSGSSLPDMIKTLSPNETIQKVQVVNGTLVVESQPIQIADTQVNGVALTVADGIILNCYDGSDNGSGGDPRPEFN